MNLSDYIALFPGTSRDRPSFIALAQAVLKQVVDLQAVIASIQGGYSFLQAEGEMLDALAASVGLSRADSSAGMNSTDEQFRDFLLAKLALWGWDGTNESLPAVLAAGLPGSSETDNRNGTATVSPPGTDPALIPVPAGVRAIN